MAEYVETAATVVENAHEAVQTTRGGTGIIASLVDCLNLADTANVLELGGAAAASGALDAWRRSGRVTERDEATDPLLERGPASCCDRARLCAETTHSRCKTACPRTTSALGALLSAGFDVLSAVLIYADLATDVALMADLFQTSNPIWGSLVAYFIVMQFAASFAGLHAYVTRVADGWVQTAHLLLGFPLSPLALDVAMLLRPLGLLRHVPRASDLEPLLLQYKATRALLEVTLEALPQTILQSYIFVRVAFMGAGGTLAVSLPILLNSLALSTASLLKAWLTAWFGARELGLGLGSYLNLLLQMFKGLPFEALRSNVKDECTLKDVPLGPDLAGVLARVLGKYNTSLTTLDLTDCVVQPTDPSEKLQMDAALAELAEAIVRHPALVRVRMAASESAWLDVGSLKASTEIDVRGRHLDHPATIALLIALARTNGAHPLDTTGVELSLEHRDKLRAAVGSRLRGAESVEEVRREARVGPLLRKLGTSVEELRAARQLDWSSKQIVAGDLEDVVQCLFIPGVLGCLEALK